MGQPFCLGVHTVEQANAAVISKVKKVEPVRHQSPLETLPPSNSLERLHMPHKERGACEVSGPISLDQDLTMGKSLLSCSPTLAIASWHCSSQKDS